MWIKKYIPTKRTKFTLGLLFVLSIITLSSISPVPALAAQNSNNPDGVDFFIIIDQTNSMRFNDPQDLRISVAQYFLNYAAFYAFSHPDSVNQISVMNFGETSEITPLTPFPITKTLADSVLLKELGSNLTSSNLGEADLITVLGFIDSELKSSSYQDENRQKVILVITDGNPVSSPLNETDIRTDFAQLGEGLNSLREKHKGELDLVTVGIYPQTTYWSNIVGPYWQSISKSAVQVQQLQDFKNEVTKNISPLLGYGGRIYTSGEEILTDPYQNEMQFLVQKYSPSDEILVEYDDGIGYQTLELDTPNVTRYQGDYFELFVIKNPSVSSWRFSSTLNGRLDILKASTPILIDLAYPPKNVALNIPFYFQFDSLDYKISENKSYPLIWDVNLVEPDGVVQNLNLVNDGSVFQSEKSYVPTKLGDYKITATLSYNSNDIKDPILLYSDEYVFSSFEPEFSLEPSSPYVQYGPIQNLTLLIKDQNGDSAQLDPKAKLTIFLRLYTSPNQVDTFSFNKNGDAYVINDSLFLRGDGSSSIDVVIADDAKKELVVRNFFVETFSNIELKTPSNQVAQYSTNTSIELVLLNPDGSRYIPPTSDNLKLNVTIIPSAEESPVTALLEFNEQSESFITQLPEGLPSNKLGETIVRVNGVYTINGKEIQAFEKELNYSVVANLPIFRVISPATSKEGYPLYVGFEKVGVPVQIQWVKGDIPVDPKTIFTNNPADLISIDILKEGKVYLPDIKLSQVSEADPSIWGTNIMDLNTAGNYEVIFRLNNAILISKQPYELESSTASFTLFEDIWQRIFKIGGISFIVLVIGIFGMREIIERREPYPMGQLAVVEHNIDLYKDIAVVQLTGKRRRTVKVKIVDPNLIKLGINHLVIRHANGQRGTHAGGIVVTGLGKKGDRVFSLQFDREQEKRIPRGDQPQVYYGLSYKPYEAPTNSAFTN